MTSEMNRSRIIVILLFAITFTMIGWLAPVMYASYVPASDIIEEHKFTGQHTTPDADSHYVCFDRTVHIPSSGKTFTELYMVDNNGERIEVATMTEDRYFQSGRTAVSTQLDLPDDVVEGEYRYLLVVELQMANGRVTRTMAYHSDPFVISDDVDMRNDEAFIDGC